MQTKNKKKVAVTGAGGFIGSHVVEDLLAAGYAVRALVRYTSGAGIGNLAFLDGEMKADLEIVFGDIRDAGMMRSFLQGCDAVLHLAALIGIPYSYVAPASYIQTNVTGVLNILEAARANETARVVITSTSEVYGTAQYVPIDEDHPLQAQSPYSASKIGGDKLAESYFRSFEVPVVTLRPFNTYGPRQSARAVIPTILSQLLAGTKEVRLGSLAPKRDLVFVKDTARGFRLALETPGIEGQTIHLGTNSAVSIGELAQLCLEVTGRQATIGEDPTRVRPAKSEVGHLQADPARAKRLLGWEPATALEDGIRQTADFMAEHPELHDSARYAV
ncbi:MAG: NAD-dependent epimerase/dehydratase family protein [Verrucomicrobia bacterium]|jgi:NAD dependent epimerase/dehydratase|nr:NAD-dependent epimerase/dehydratase family protein [Verrucomicrobiota bacterium]MBT7701374.1 NAD-dependent epimerase/dehydratase family protein [Verrucomicrobiota bacterium]